MPDLFKTLSRLLKDPYRGIEGVLKFRNENRNSDLNSIDTFLKRKGFPKKLRAFGFQLGWSTGHPQSQRKDGKSRLSDAMRYLTSFGDSSYQRILARGFQEGQKEGLDFFWDTDAKAFPQGAVRVASRYMEIRRRNKVAARYLIEKGKNS